MIRNAEPENIPDTSGVSIVNVTVGILVARDINQAMVFPETAGPYLNTIDPSPE